MYEQSLPRPIVVTANVEDASLVRTFRRLYRLPAPQVPANMPTACALVLAQPVEFAEVQRLAGTADVFVYWDDGAKLRRTGIAEVAAFLATREPWEDYDFCIFPEGLAWCAGLTHNDNWLLSKQEKRVSQTA